MTHEICNNIVTRTKLHQVTALFCRFLRKCNFAKFVYMDADNGGDNRVTDFALIRKASSHASSLVLTLDDPIWACAPTRFVHFPATYFARANIVNINIR